MTCLLSETDRLSAPTHRATVRQLDEQGRVWRTFTRLGTLAELAHLPRAYRSARITTEEI